MKILGISGTDGSGKDSLGHYLQDGYNWFFISVTDLLRDEARRRSMPLSRRTLKEISAEWRAESGLGVLVDKAVQEYKRQSGQFGGLVLASLRNPGEADEIHKLGGQVVWMDAPIELRYERAVARNKGTEDQITFQEFQAEEQAQMQNLSNDPTRLDLSAVKAKADIFINNDTNNLGDFKRTIRQNLSHILG